MDEYAAITTERQLGTIDRQSGLAEANASGVSWAAVFAGAFVAAALSLILLALGTGLGLSSISPWSNAGASAFAVGSMAIGWLILTEMISSAMGGYLAGRLRTKWTRIHTDEVYFRDTAHGFLAWAVSLVVSAAFLASAAASMVGATAQLGAGTGMATAVSSEVQSNEPSAESAGYFVDSLFRSDRPNPEKIDTSAQGEAGRIFANALREKDMPAADKTYVAQLVAARTGLSQADAENRVSEVMVRARQAADTARKAAAYVLLWTFLALLIGAFCASFAATIGGRQRDHVKVI